MKNKLKQSRDYFYIVRDRESAEARGVLRLDRQSDKSFLVSIYVDPSSYGKGVAKSALALADKIFPEATFNAFVQRANLASQRLFESAGYDRLSTEQFRREPIG